MSVAIPAVEADFAYRDCERITRAAAANFYYGIRLLPRPKRQAMSAVYAFARRVDDIGDRGGLDADTQLLLLAAERRTIQSIGEARVADDDDAVATALAHACRRYQLPLDALELLIDGVELDVRGTRYETFDELLVYCRDVAGSIGRLCVTIFTGGKENCPPEASTLADALGVAMQLTNILRDVREDHERGRSYLPDEDLRRFGCQQLPDVPDDRAEALIRFEAARAQDWFARGLRLLELLDGPSAACVMAMTGIYRSILRRIASDPCVVLRRRISLPAWEKAWLAAGSVARSRRARGEHA
jgi:15-cis-phytoene synthase